ncbi:hypothetical protein [Jatrophihabitans fulvus]
MQGTRRTLTGLGLVVGGALLGMLALTALPWFRSDFGGILTNGSGPSALRSTLAYYSDREDRLGGFVDVGVSKPFFGWLGILVLAAAVLAAVFAAGSDAGARAGRVGSSVSAVLALAGVVLTLNALYLIGFDPLRAPKAGIRPSTPTYGDYLSSSGVGAWAMVLAFLAIGVGALVAAGSRERLRELLSDRGPADDTDEQTAADPVGAEQPSARRERDETW